jgi:hypothetical protein
MANQLQKKEQNSRENRTERMYDCPVSTVTYQTEFSLSNNQTGLYSDMHLLDLAAQANASSSRQKARNE